MLAANGHQLSMLQEAEPARLVLATPVLVGMGGLVGMLPGLGWPSCWESAAAAKSSAAAKTWSE